MNSNISDNVSRQTAHQRQKQRAREIQELAASLGAKRIDGYRWKLGRAVVGARHLAKLARRRDSLTTEKNGGIQ